MIKSIVFLTIIFCMPICAQNKKSQKKLISEKEKSTRLLKLITKEEKLIKSMRTLGPKLRWRLVEINSEKLKIIKKKENAQFLAGSIKNPKRKKRSYFKESIALEKLIYSDGLKIISQWNRFLHVGDIYYTLALNNRDYGDKKKIENMLLMALKTSASLELTYLSKVALAEYYYNNKKYLKAIKLYKAVVKRASSPWISKHLYNYSWCLTKVKKFNSAIAHAKLALSLGRKDGFVSISEQIFTNIGLFYIMARKTSDGADFYLEEVKDPTDYIIKMAKKTASDISYESAEELYSKALKNSLQKEFHDSTMLLYLEQLTFFRSFKKDKNFWNTSLLLEKHAQKYKIQDEHRKWAIKTIKSYTNYLQTHFRNNIERFSSQDVNYKPLLRYMDILVTLDIENKDFYTFYQAEVFLALTKYQDSLPYYKESLKTNMVISKKSLDYKKHLEHRKSIFDSLFFALESNEIEKEVKRNYTQYAYNQHIALYPHSKRTLNIFPKLFHLYFSKLEIQNAKKTLDLFIKNFPKKRVTQRKLNTNIIDHYIKEKNIEKILPMVLLMEKGHLGYSKKYVKNALLILSNLIFKKYEAIAKKGNLKEAISGYETLFKRKRTPRSLKGHAAFKLFEINLKQSNNILAYKWLKRSYPLLEKDDLAKLAPIVQDYSRQFFLEQKFSLAAKYNQSYLIKRCKYSHPMKEDMFSLLLTSRLMNDKIKNSISILKAMNKCGVKESVYKASLKNVFNHLTKYHKINVAINFLNVFKKEKSLKKIVRLELTKKFWRYFNNNNNKNINKIMVFMKNRDTKTYQKLFTFKSDYEKILKNMLLPMAQYNNDKKFLEDSFNTTLEKNMTLIQSIRNKLTPYFTSKDAHIAANSFKVFSHYLQSFTEELSTLSPQGHGKDYNKGFRAAMKQIINGFNKEDKRLNTSLNKTIESAHIIPKFKSFQKNLIRSLSPSNELSYRHPASLFIIPIDQERK